MVIMLIINKRGYLEDLEVLGFEMRDFKSITLNFMYQNGWKIINTFIYVLINILNHKLKILENIIQYAKFTF